ncbi:Ectonucleotide pyrophosphatase/phosphodiesterase family member 3 [Camellia lanceoleosa]|uniref:Ectonucleotide pyrophosphatase/phosphodiesterase family member 3 n=1 Tax=Camellia lanceoleosa TaxID=1840588 RepID=A0ACC0FJ02_9ERIC|nr:Ectonucleotide pyrophosphatase/phosphodiesterase family member 3 [Camellia lanceoleosa]
MQFQLMKKTHQTQPALLTFNTDHPSPPPSKPTTTTVLFISSSSSLTPSPPPLSPSSSSPLPPPHPVSQLFFHTLVSRLLPQSNHRTVAELFRPLTKLTHPAVLLVSSDGFRLVPIQDPNPQHRSLDRQWYRGRKGFDLRVLTLTFPNHYSIVTGLYHFHGIINNHFVDPYTGEGFNMGVMNPSGGWVNPCETVVNHGLKVATYLRPVLRSTKVLDLP